MQNERPPDVKCMLCGVIVLPYIDGNRWVYSGYGVTTINGVPVHDKCYQHGDIWRRIQAIEKAIGR
jgi:hypothetical protein